MTSVLAIWDGQLVLIVIRVSDEIFYTNMHIFMLVQKKILELQSIETGPILNDCLGNSSLAWFTFWVHCASIYYINEKRFGINFRCASWLETTECSNVLEVCIMICFKA